MTDALLMRALAAEALVAALRKENDDLQDDNSSLRALLEELEPTKRPEAKPRSSREKDLARIIPSETGKMAMLQAYIDLMRSRDPMFSIPSHAIRKPTSMCGRTMHIHEDVWARVMLDYVAMDNSVQIRISLTGAACPNGGLMHSQSVRADRASLEDYVKNKYATQQVRTVLDELCRHNKWRQDDEFDEIACSLIEHMNYEVKRLYA